MLTLAQRSEFRKAAADLDAVTVEAVLNLLAGMDVTRSDFVADLLDGLPAVVGELFDVSALLGVTAYDLSRSQSGVKAGFSAFPAPTLPLDRVQGMARWALTPVFENATVETPLTPRELTVKVRQNLTAGTPRLVRHGERDTVWGNAGVDPARPRYARLARPAACDFCHRLSSRGAVYVTKEAASVVGFDKAGRGPRQRQQRRGPQKVGASFHDHCHCQPVALFPGDDMPGTNDLDLAA